MSARSASILLVEDDSNDVLLIRRAFKKVRPELRIDIVSDGEEAISYLDRQPPYDDRTRYPAPSLMLLDLKLPRRNGLEVLEWVRRHATLKYMLVVVLTSSQENPDINRAYELGVNSYLVKPVGFEDLVDLMGQVDRYWFTLNKEPRIPNGWSGWEA